MELPKILHHGGIASEAKQLLKLGTATNHYLRHEAAVSQNIKRLANIELHLFLIY